VSDSLVINEIYLSLQGESTFAGLPCVFVRLTRATFAAPIVTPPMHSPKQENDDRSRPRRGESTGCALQELAPRASHLALPLVELTGGEPLLQGNSLLLMKNLCDDGFAVLLETSGAQDISPVDRGSEGSWI